MIDLPISLLQLKAEQNRGFMKFPDIGFLVKMLRKSRRISCSGSVVGMEFIQIGIFVHSFSSLWLTSDPLMKDTFSVLLFDAKCGNFCMKVAHVKRCSW